MTPDYLAKRIIDRIKRHEDPIEASITEFRKHGASRDLIKATIPVVNRVIANVLQKKSHLRPVEFPTINPIEVLRRINEVMQKKSELNLSTIYRRLFEPETLSKRAERLLALSKFAKNMKHARDLVHQLTNKSTQLKVAGQELVDYLATYPEYLPQVRSIMKKSQYITTILRKVGEDRGTMEVIQPNTDLDNKVKKVLELEDNVNHLMKELNQTIGELRSLSRIINNAKANDK